MMPDWDFRFSRRRVWRWLSSGMRMTAFSDISPCSLDVTRRFRGAYCLHNKDYEGSTHLWNVDLLKRDYTALYPRRPSLHSRRRKNLKSHVFWDIHHHHHRLDSPTWTLAFLRSFCQLKYPAIAFSYFVTRVFSGVGLSSPRPNPSYPRGPMYSVRVVSLSWLVPVLKRQDLAFCPCMT
jgi:hypothetical protein